MEIIVTNLTDTIRRYFIQKYEEIKTKYKYLSKEEKNIKVNETIINYFNHLKDNKYDTYKTIINLMAVDFYKEINYKLKNNIEVSETKKSIFEIYDTFNDIEDLIQFIEENNYILNYILVSFLTEEKISITKKKEIYDSLKKEDYEKINKLGKNYLLDKYFIEYMNKEKNKIRSFRKTN